MTIYNFNKGIGWASSGVEYAQAYRANIFKNNEQKAKFIFTDIFYENIEPMTKNIGFDDEEVIWFYQYFTDTKTSPTTYTLEQLEKSFLQKPDSIKRLEQQVIYGFNSEEIKITAFLDQNASSECVYKVETHIKDKLLQRDYYTYVKIFSEYFKPVNNQANLFQRRFFNENGSIAYDELLNGEQSLYIFDDRTIFSFENLMLYFMECLNFTSQDIVIMDRSTGMGPEMVRAKGAAKLGVVIHAEHFNEPLTTEDFILWNNFYDYQFENAQHIDFFITATEKQKEIIEAQFKQYEKGPIKVYAIPVGSVDKLEVSSKRKENALMTASRLAGEKHIDWLIKAVVEARKVIPNLSLDIYGQGGQLLALSALISELDANTYIHLKGQQDLSDIYKKYPTYIAASTSEGFGLTLLEAVGSGLGMIGFDVRYGNQTFIKNGVNGYLIPYEKNDTPKNIQALSQAIVLYHQQSASKREIIQETSYRIAEPFLTSHVGELWLKLEEELINDKFI